MYSESVSINLSVRAVNLTGLLTHGIYFVRIQTDFLSVNGQKITKSGKGIAI